MEKSSNRRRGRMVAILLLGRAASRACGWGSATRAPSRTPSPTLSRSPSPTATRGPPACPDRVFAVMTEDQRIGQLLNLGLAGDRLGPTEINLVQADHIGSVWFVATSTAGLAGVQAVTSAVQAQDSGASTGNVRFFIAANLEGGVIHATQGPSS